MQVQVYASKSCFLNQPCALLKEENKVTRNLLLTIISKEEESHKTNMF